MTRKLKIAIVFLVLIVAVSGYCLWEIDRHEKALLGQGWLNPVPYSTWQKYLTDKANYEKTVAQLEISETELLGILLKYRDPKQSRLDDLLLSLETWVPVQFNLTHAKQTQFAKEYPEEFKRWQQIISKIQSMKYSTPAPSNPPRSIILQTINSYYRYMFAADGILVLGLIVFLVLYKESDKV